uniref:Integrin beta N-terminal domain-containing protein n=1 Tax=Salarias fasciatus TaxID=181472 RepID=A0A672FVU2_SALFA
LAAFFCRLWHKSIRCMAASVSVCKSPAVSSCADCLRRGPQCAWCFKEDFLHGAGLSRRCGLPVNLQKQGCGPEFMEHPDVKVEVNATISSTQVSPQDISVTLRPGRLSHASVQRAVPSLSDNFKLAVVCRCF